MRPSALFIRTNILMIFFSVSRKIKYTMFKIIAFFITLFVRLYTWGLACYSHMVIYVRVGMLLTSGYICEGWHVTRIRLYMWGLACYSHLVIYVRVGILLTSGYICEGWHITHIRLYMWGLECYSHPVIYVKVGMLLTCTCRKWVVVYLC